MGVAMFEQRLHFRFSENEGEQRLRSPCPFSPGMQIVPPIRSANCLTMERQRPVLQFSCGKKFWIRATAAGTLADRKKIYAKQQVCRAVEKNTAPGFAFSRALSLSFSILVGIGIKISCTELCKFEKRHVLRSLPK